MWGNKQFSREKRLTFLYGEIYGRNKNGVVVGNENEQIYNEETEPEWRPQAVWFL